MKRKFTKLMAALALLVFMAPSMVGWGQETATVSASKPSSQTSWNWTDDHGNTWSANVTWKTSAPSNPTNMNSGYYQMGTKDNPPASVEFSTSGITGTITQIVVNCASYQGNGSISCTVNNTAFGTQSQNIPSWSSNSGGNVTFSNANGATGAIKVTMTNSDSGRAMYIKSIAVTYTTGGSTTYTVTYDGNGSDSGTVPVDNNEYEENDEVTVLGPGTMGKTGHTFAWWTTDEEGEGDPYEEGDPYNITDNTTFYAQWEVSAYNYTLNFTGADNNAMAQLYVDNEAVATNAKIAYGKEVTIFVIVSEGYSYTIGVKDASNNDVPVANDKFTMPASNVTVTVTTTLIPTYTIDFEAGTGTAVSSITGLEGSTITLPTTTPSAACVSRGWTFAGWATANVSETNTAPALLNGQYTVTGNATLYAVYKVTEGDGGTTTFNFETIASENGWTDASQHTTVEISPVTITANGGGNNGKYYVSDKTWRMYNGGSVSITATGNNITSVSSDPSTTFTISNGSATQSFSATTKFKSIAVTYGSSTTTYNSNPSCLPMVATPTFTPAAGTYTGSQNVTIECDTDEATIHYKTAEEGEWMTYNAAIPVSTTTTIWAKATKNGMDDSEIATATYTIQYTLTVDIDDVVEYFLYDYTNETWDEITIDDDGHALVFSGADVRISGGEVFDDCYEVESFNVTDGNNDPVTVVDNTEEDGTYSFIMPASNATLTVTLDEIATHYTLTVEGLNHVSFELLVGTMSSITTLDANRQASICEHSMVEIDNLTVGYGYVLESVTLTTPGNEPVELTKDAASGLYIFEMPSSNATLAFITGNASYFEAFTGELTEGDYLIVYNGKAMKNSVTSNRLDYIEVTATNDIICADNSIIWHIAPSGDYWTIYSADAEAYAAGNGTNNQAQMLADGTDNKALWAVSGNEVFEFVNKYNSDNYRNANLRNNGTYGFACYNPNNIGGALSLYKKVTPQNYTTMEIHPNQWYFIASPTGTSPVDVNVLSDLYYYDEKDHYWRNQKVFANAEGFVNFDLGKGYLAANAGESVTESVTLTFTGVAITANSYSVDLEYNANTSGNETNTLAGWNLVGNPFPSSATINKDFYVISGKNVMANTGSTVIAPCTGVMVQAEGENESVTFTKVTEGQTPQPNQLQMTVAQNATNRGTAETIDNAIVSFNEGSQLEKFIFNADLSKLYIPQNDKEYAIVSAEAQGEMPVNFRATKNGTYTLTINPEGVEMNYLHLIDNMTGANIDLLQTPSYTFNASMNDYESRFKLVFAAGSSTGSEASETFAFFANGELIVSNEGEATLQVVDMTGRILSSQSLNGNGSVQMAAPVGVYVLRLISGNEVKTQKIVVR